MIGDRFEVSILNVEINDSEHSLLSCHISIDNKTCGVVSPVNTDNDESTVKIAKKGCIKFIVREIVSEEEIGSISMPGSILPVEGFQWLPLLKATDDYVTALPKRVTSPRILVLFNYHKSLHPVHEVTESSENESQNQSFTLSEEEPEVMPEIKLWQSHHDSELIVQHSLENQIMRLESQNEIFQQEIERNQKIYMSSIDSLNFEIYELKKKEKNNAKIQKAMLKTAEEFKEMLNKEKEEKEKIAKQLEAANAALEKNKKDAETKQGSLLVILESKDTVIYKKQCEINSLKKSIKNLEDKNLKLEENSNQIDLLNHQIEALKQRLGEKDKIEVDNKNFKDIEAALQLYLYEKNISGLIKLIQNDKYECGSLDICLFIKNGVIYCKLDEAEMTIDEFIANHCKAEIELMEAKRKIKESFTPNKVTRCCAELETENTESAFSRCSFSSEKTQSKSPVPDRKATKRNIKVSNFLKSYSPPKETPKSTKKDVRSLRKTSHKWI